MLDPLFPVRLESLTHKNAQTVMSQGEYLIALLAEGRSVYKHASERGVLEQGRLFLAGERTAFTLTLQRASLLKTVRFNRSFYDRLALQFYDSGFLDSFFPRHDKECEAVPVIVDPARGREEVRVLFERMEKEYAERLSRYALMIQNLLTELFILLDRERGREETAATVTLPDNLNALILYIQEHYTDEFTLEELSSRLNLTPAYFSRLFHEKTGKPLFEFINSIRIQKACQLLKRTNLSIIEIAYTVGYNNLSFFNRYFRRLMRMSPREYKNL